MSKVEVRLNGALGHCRCGAQTTKVIAVNGIPKVIALNGKINIPFCDECFAKSALGRRAMRHDEETRMAGPSNPARTKAVNASKQALSPVAAKMGKDAGFQPAFFNVKKKK